MLQMVKDLENRVAALEKRSASPDLAAIQELVRQTVADAPTQERKMCPKCGEKPAYHFHVKNCTGKKEEKQDASTDGRTTKGDAG